MTERPKQLQALDGAIGAWWHATASQKADTELIEPVRRRSAPPGRCCGALISGRDCRASRNFLPAGLGADFRRGCCRVALCGLFAADRHPADRHQRGGHSVHRGTVDQARSRNTVAGFRGISITSK